jgi:hypothetical protein
LPGFLPELHAELQAITPTAVTKPPYLIAGECTAAYWTAISHSCAPWVGVEVHVTL